MQHAAARAASQDMRLQGLCGLWRQLGLPSAPQHSVVTNGAWQALSAGVCPGPAMRWQGGRPERGCQERLGRRLAGVGKTFRSGYCRLQMLFMGEGGQSTGGWGSD